MTCRFSYASFNSCPRPIPRAGWGLFDKKCPRGWGLFDKKCPQGWGLFDNFCPQGWGLFEIFVLGVGCGEIWTMTNLILIPKSYINVFNT